MTDPGDSSYFVNPGKAPRLAQMEGVETRVLTGLGGEGMMMVLTTVRPGCEVPDHAHVHEQIGYVVSGRAVMTVAGEAREVGPGDAYGVPPDVPHGARCLGEETFAALDIFHPGREDFLEKLGR
jgi:quercetin dioxygenase-like cupin family protein